MFSKYVFAGWNNNPNDIQLTSSYRKLLVCMPYLSARKGNCIINSTNVLTVSSQHVSTQAHRPAQPSLQVIQPIEINDEDFHHILNLELEPYDNHTRAFVASIVEKNICRNISKRSKSACQDCLNVFAENRKIHNEFIARINRTKPHSQPCLSTTDIFSACDAVSEILKPRGYVDVNVLAKTVFGKLNFDELYDCSSFHAHENTVQETDGLLHKQQFIYDVLYEYFNIKAKKIGKRITIEEQNGRAIRRNLTRNIINSGQ